MPYRHLDGRGDRCLTVAASELMVRGNYSGLRWRRAIVLLDHVGSLAGERDLDGNERIVAERGHRLQVAGDVWMRAWAAP